MAGTLPYQFIAIEGNIGVGKTTLSKMIANDFGCKLILEQFTDNPFLPFFYEQPERYAFPVELFFMTERHKQLQDSLSQPDLFQQSTIADYFFLKTLLFAQNNLNEQEYRLFQRLFHILNATFPKPDLLLYLHSSVDVLLRNIKRRGREMEQEMNPAYLYQIQNAYLSFFKTEASIPILIMDLEDSDFLRNETDYQKLLHLIQQPYEEGVHRVKL